MEEPAARGEEQSCDRISCRDHFFAPDRVEEMTEHNRPENVSESERQQVTTDVLRGHVVEAHQNQPVGKEDRVVEKCLRQHEDEAEE